MIGFNVFLSKTRKASISKST